MSYHPHYNEGAPGEAASRNRNRRHGEHYYEQHEYRDYREQDERTSPRQPNAPVRSPLAPMNPVTDLGINTWAPMYSSSTYHSRPNLEELATELNAVSEFVSPERLSERNAPPRAPGGLTTLYRDDDPPQFFTPNSSRQHVSVYQSGEQPVFSEHGSNAWDRHADAETGSRTSFASYGGRAPSSSTGDSPQDELPYSFNDHMNAPNHTLPYPRSPQSDSHQDYNSRQAEAVTVNPRSMHHTVSDFGDSGYAGSECAPRLQVNDTYRGAQTATYTHLPGGSSRQTNGRRPVRVPSTNPPTHLDPLRTLSRSSSGSGPRVTSRGTTHSTPRRRPANGRHQRTQSHTHPTPVHPDPSDEPRANRFPCDYLFAGCSASFASKNEWKRHLTTQHLQEHLWRCHLSACNTTGRANAAFNRKDLLGQHIKRMHANHLTGHHSLQQMQEDMKFQNRVMPQESKCGFCEMEFEGDGSWDKRMEHVGKHYEDGMEDGYDVGQAFIAWSMRERLVKIVSGRYALVAAGKEQAQMGKEVGGRELMG